MASFTRTISPTPFGQFDSDETFQSHADSMIPFVKRKLGDDILSVELTRKQVWACFEEASFEYSKLVNEYTTKSQLSNLLGISTGSMSGSEGLYPRETLEFLMRKAEPYIAETGVGGSYNSVSGSIQLVQNVQDYDIYNSLKDSDDNNIFDSQSTKSKLRIWEVFHLSPQAAYRFFDTTSAINYLNNEFSFESFTPETAFYVLPVFEDVLRAGQMKVSNRVRKSNYSYKITGTKIRIFPKPTSESPGKLFFRVGFSSDINNPPFQDDTIYGANSPANVPFGNLTYSNVNSMGHQWIRQYTLALSKELLGLVRSKFSSVPISEGDLTLNGSELISQGREDKDKLRTELKEMLDTLTYDKLIESDASQAENMQRILKTIPMPVGKGIVIG